jgi:hypothetical protein
MQPQLMSRVVLGIVATALPLVAALSPQNRSLRALLSSCVALLLLAACDPGDMVLVVPDEQINSGPSIRVLVVRPDGEPAAHAVVYFQLPDPWSRTPMSRPSCGWTLGISCQALGSRACRFVPGSLPHSPLSR